MGSADVIPGVSGGTMAFILGIYTELVQAIRSFDLIWLKELIRLNFKAATQRLKLGFLIPLGIGIIAALLVFTRLIPVPKLLQQYPEPVYGFFFGLILASIIYLLGKTKGFKGIDALYLLAGTIVGWLIFTMIPVETPNASWFIFLSGSLAICAMLLPGISGSFILLILNKYSYIFDAIGYFKLSILIPFGLGAITGLVLFSRFLSFLLSRFYKQTVMFIIGLLVASLWVIWPFQERLYATFGEKIKIIKVTPIVPGEINNTVLLAILMIIIGLFVIFIVELIANRKQARIT